MDTYVTLQGDTWDLIAYKVYGNELYADRLMSENIQYIGVWVFGAGTVLNIPEITEDEDTELPPWRY